MFISDPMPDLPQPKLTIPYINAGPIFTFQRIKARDVVAARVEILNLIQGNLKNNIIYFDGWDGFGATAVLRSIAQTLPSMKSSPKLRFGRIIYIDCSRWESKRVMQRKIAEELKLDQKTMAMFEEQDEEDDFNGVDHGSRDVIREVSVMIDQTLRESRFMMIFINGSTDEVDLSEFGILEYYSIIIWTFGRRVLTVHDMRHFHSLERTTKNLRHTGLFIFTVFNATNLSDSQLNALFHEEVANIVARYPYMPDYNFTMLIHCCRFGFFLRRSSSIGLDWAGHASNFWICDGVIQQEDRAREISNALDSEITFEGDASLLDRVFPILMQHPETSHLLVGEKDDSNIDKYENRPYRWISINSKNNTVQGKMQIILARASTVFLSFDRTVSAPRLTIALFKQCNKFGILILSCCAFSFLCPPFLHCKTLRFLGLNNCIHQNNTSSELEGGECITKWTFLHSLWVLDLRYTDWGEILSEEKITLMANITELNIEGVMCWQYTGQLLEKRLPCLQRLRIIKPAHQEENTSMDTNNSFVDKKQLEILDLSGNSGMKNLPESLSEASKLQVLVLDGCDGLQNVVQSNSSLRSFSFDGYGPASHWTSTGKLPPMSSRPKYRPFALDKKDPKASKISLQGCTLLKDVFLRGLPNLEELDLSGCSIKVLDFGAMVVDVPRLKRLFLLGCECLRAIKWGSEEQQSELRLELICIDTRPWSETVLGYTRPLSLGARRRSFQLQLHAIFADARLARSLWAHIKRKPYSSSNACCFDISITSSAACTAGTSQPIAAQSKEMIIGSSDRQRHYDIAIASMYSDVFMVADDPSPMQAFPPGPTGKLDRHIEIGDGSRNVPSEADGRNNLSWLMAYYAQSVHVHDVTGCTNVMPISWRVLRWCRVERCPDLHAVFPPGGGDETGTLETIWASNLLMAHCIWSKHRIMWPANRFNSLEHLHLRSCPSLRYALAIGLRPTFPCLKTIHIIHCGDLKHIFVAAEEENHLASVRFPKLSTIHLHDLPALRQICEGEGEASSSEMLAPKLETIKIRGCWSLRRLPALKGRKRGMRRPTVEIEKDVWDALVWDGVDDGHHPSLYEAPVHSRYYKRPGMLRGTVLR